MIKKFLTPGEKRYSALEIGMELFFFLPLCVYVPYFGNGVYSKGWRMKGVCKGVGMVTGWGRERVWMIVHYVLSCKPNVPRRSALLKPHFSLTNSITTKRNDGFNWHLLHL